MNYIHMFLVFLYWVWLSNQFPTTISFISIGDKKKSKKKRVKRYLTHRLIAFLNCDLAACYCRVFTLSSPL